MIDKTPTILTMKEGSLKPYRNCEVHGPNCIERNCSVTCRTLGQLVPGRNGSLKWPNSTSFPEFFDHGSNALRELIAARQFQPISFPLQVKFSIAFVARER